MATKKNKTRTGVRPARMKSVKAVSVKMPKRKSTANKKPSNKPRAASKERAMQATQTRESIFEKMPIFKTKDNGKEGNIVARIKVVGIGGAGGNALTRMAEDFPRGVELVAINTDIQDLNQCGAKKRICIGKNLTRGLGTGMNPELGRQAAEENREEIAEAIRDADMIFLTAGFGGGSGSGGAPVVAEIAKELGILTVAIVTKPFSFEGSQRAHIAEEALIRLRDRVDTIITIPNDKIFSIINKDTSLVKAFEEVDKVLRDSVKGITELILTPGIINIDFADIKAVMRDAGAAMVGIGIASGPGRAAKAADLAINSPLLEISLEGAKGILFCVSGRNDLKMHEINEIAGTIAQSADSSAKIIFGTYYDRKVNKGQIKITIIGSGFGNSLLHDSRYVPFVSNEDLVPKNLNHLPFVDDRQQKREDKFLDEEEVDVLNREEEEVEIEKKEKEWDIPAFLRKRKKKY